MIVRGDMDIYIFKTWYIFHLLNAVIDPSGFSIKDLARW